MKKYITFLKLKFKGGLQYRGAAWAGIATQFTWGSMRILLFYILYQENPDTFPMGFSEYCTYIWLQQAFVLLFSAFSVDVEILDSITTGGVAYELCRPTDTYFMWMFRDMGRRFSLVLLRGPFILVVAFFIPQPFGLSLPSGGIIGLLYFLVSLVLGALLTSTFTMLIYVFSFSTISSSGIRAIFLCITELLMGQIIPVAFFPEAIKPIVELLPFASIQNTPLMIYCGEMEVTLSAIVLQVVWAAALILAGKAAMSKITKKIVVQGG